MTRYEDDVHGQPDALRTIAARFGRPASAFVAWADAWRAAGQPPIVLTGMGASLYAAQGIQASLARAGLPVRAIATSDLLDFEAGALESGFTIVVSQSGESTEAKDLLGQIEPGRVFSITNRPGSTLGASSGQSVSLEIPGDRSVAVRTYTCSLAALLFLAAELEGRQRSAVGRAVRGAADEIDRMLPTWDAATAPLADAVARARFVSFVGWNAGIASAHEAALLMKEGARTPSEGMGAAQFRHGAVEVVDERHVTVVFANSVGDSDREDYRAYIAEFAALPGTVVTVGADVPAAHAPGVIHLPTEDRGSPANGIADIVPIQLLAGRVAARLGFEAGEFRNTTPVISERPGERAGSTRVAS